MGRPLDEMAFTVTRRPGDWTTDGTWTPSGSPSTFTLLACRPQPTGPELMEMLDEGARTSARYMIIAQDDQPEIYLVGAGREGFAADTVVYDSRTFVFTADGDWGDFPLGYNGYILTEFAPDEKVPTP